MTALVIVLAVAAGLALSAAVALLLGRAIHIADQRSRPLPHRPAPNTPPRPGPRHRVDDAHTASISATQVLRALRTETDLRDAEARWRAEP